MKLSTEERDTAAFYDSYPFKSVIKRGQRRKQFFKKIKIRGHVLDAGSGSGRTSQLIKELHPSCDITCLDISKKSLDRLPFKKKVQASILNMPFKNQEFDFVVSIGCLHHTPDARKGFKECVRVLRKKGGIIIALYNKWNSYNWIYTISKHAPRFIKDAIKHPLVQDQLFTPHASFHSPKEVKRWFKEENVKLITYTSTGYTPPYLFKNLGQFVYYYGIKEK